MSDAAPALKNEFVTLLAFFEQALADASRPYALHRKLLPEIEFFSVARLQQLLNNPLLSPDWIQLTLAGQVLNLADSCLWKVVQRKRLMCMDKSALNAALGQGASVILEGLDLLDASINQLCGEIDRRLPCGLSNCVAFFSQRNNEAYGGHRDADNVLVVQVSGEKLWHIHQPQPRRLTANSPLTASQMGPVMEQVVMQPGDVLFLRAGVPHRCVTHADHSLHLAFDLSDRTPNINDITAMANDMYLHSPAPTNSPSEEIVRQYIALLSSPQMKQTLSQLDAQNRQGTRDMRDWLGNTASVDALDRFVRPS